MQLPTCMCEEKKRIQPTVYALVFTHTITITITITCSNVICSRRLSLSLCGAVSRFIYIKLVLSVYFAVPMALFNRCRSVPHNFPRLDSPTNVLQHK